MTHIILTIIIVITSVVLFVVGIFLLFSEGGGLIFGLISLLSGIATISVLGGD